MILKQATETIEERASDVAADRTVSTDPAVPRSDEPTDGFDDEALCDLFDSLRRP